MLLQGQKKNKIRHLLIYLSRIRMVVVCLVISKIVFKDMSVTGVQYWAVLPLVIPMITNTHSGVVLIANSNEPV